MKIYQVKKRLIEITVYTKLLLYCTNVKGVAENNAVYNIRYSVGLQIEYYIKKSIYLSLLVYLVFDLNCVLMC